MDASKPDTKKQTDTARRSFMWKLGAGMSAVLAATVPAFAKSAISNDMKLKTSVESLSKKVSMLEDEKSIRALHRIFEDSIDKGMYSKALDMFTDDAEVVFNEGVFKGKDRGINRLFCHHFKACLTGKKMEPAPGFELSAGQQQDTVEIAGNQKSAKAWFNYSIQAGKPVESECTLIKMARLQGEGFLRWWEGGVCELSCVKNIKDGSWKIKRLEYRALSRADFRPGRSYAKAISVPKFRTVYPKDPAGPDRLV